MSAVASVTVFVDDAVRGTLPEVCARDGVPTTDQLRRVEPVGDDRSGFGVAWLLLLAGPLGWLGLLVIAASRSGRVEELRVTLPMSEAAYQRMRTARRLRDRATLALMASGVAGLLLLMAQSGPLTRFGALVALGLAAAALVAVVIGAGRFRRERIGVRLDASRRWVTLSGVHPTFAAACDAHTAAAAPPI